MKELRPGVYRHFKGGLYLLLGQACHSETMEKMVVYQALYGERGWWIRPADMWLEKPDDKFSMLKGFSELRVPDGEEREYDLFIAVDCAALDRLG